MPGTGSRRGRTDDVGAAGAALSGAGPAGTLPGVGAELSAAVRAEARWAHDWMLAAAFPLWAERGLDRVGGGFFEKLDLETARDAGDTRRLRVQTRQIFAFGEADRLGFAGGREVIAHGLAFLDRRARLGAGHYAILFDADGGVRDDLFDLYETAFVLLALAQAYRITGDAAVRDEALRLLGLVEARLAHPAGGFRESVPARRAVRRQNPHMHLFEAAMAWMACDGAAAGASPFADLAVRLHHLFETRLFDSAAGVLPEFFDDELRRIEGPEGLVTEPGHHFEWVWLLGRYAVLTGTDSAAIAPLYAFAERHGISAPNGTAVDEVWADGTVKSAGSRFWPQTERLKAAVTMAERAPSEATADAVVEAARRMRPFIEASPTAGLWCEPLSADGVLSRAPTPASTFYHIVLAYAELCRFAGVPQGGPLPRSL
ncbi:AGE family epimerase/isomerase [Methylobrevis albus]|uniref:AGE family epimerase/isomerase n=1 Tax=Methylobrevis albus TaxID=2793297 RepID=A0A931I3X6_9HYPH|nr:AGE family epimerase/isomerase [Methylobrevis albus]MBH0239009.1 AGE family epimerase/isomerase [Methylobrevis albus]